VLLLLLLAVVHATKFGSVQPKKIDKIKLTHQYLDAWNNGDEEAYFAFFAEGFSVDDQLTGQKMGREGLLQVFRNLHSCLQSASYRLKNCKIGKEGEVIFSWEGHGKFVKELMGIQPHHKYINCGGVNVLHFNDQGLITKLTTYDKQAREQLLGKTSHREEILQLQADWCIGKVPDSHFSLTLSKEFSISTPMGKHSFEEYAKLFDIIRQAAPKMRTDWSCDPSAEDFDVWICNYHSIFPIERDTQFGLKGAKIDIEGVAVFKFDDEGKIEELESYYDLQDFLRQGTTV